MSVLWWPVWSLQLSMLDLFGPNLTRWMEALPQFTFYVFFLCSLEHLRDYWSHKKCHFWRISKMLLTKELRIELQLPEDLLSELEIMPKWLTVTWQHLRITREYLVTKRKLLKTSLTIPASIISMKVTIFIISNISHKKYIFRFVNIDQYFSIWSSWSWYLQRLFQCSSSLWFPVLTKHLHILQRMSPQQTWYCYCLWTSRNSHWI